MSEGGLLPYNVQGLPNAPTNDSTLFLAGDVRANEQVVLTAMHTLFMREHNYWADEIRALGLFDGDTIYELARVIVGAEMQAITYREFLPALLGPHALGPYHGYRPDTDPSIANEFATAAFRVGHTMLSPELLRRMPDGSTHIAGDLPLAEAFFNPDELTTIGLAPYLRGLTAQLAQDVNPYVIDDIRNFLFGPPGAGGFDLASLNIQRARDHGVASYNDLREAYGQQRAHDFGDITHDHEVRQNLAEAYDHVNQVDAWVGLLAEDHAPGAMVGRTLRSIIADQFRRLRDGDRFWYESYLQTGYVVFIEEQTLATIIRRNTVIGEEVPDDVFRVAQ